MSLNVRVITPDKVVWDADTEELILPSSTGQLGILTGHAPLLTALDIGVMRLKTGSKWTSIVLMEGFAEVETAHAMHEATFDATEYSPAAQAMHELAPAAVPVLVLEPATHTLQ